MGAKEKAQVINAKYQKYLREDRLLQAFEAKNPPPVVVLLVGGNRYDPEVFGLAEVGSVLLDTARRRQEQKVAKLEQEIERMAAAITTTEG